jgi:uncharacterized protein YjbI with pentapeptide repeats
MNRTELFYRAKELLRYDPPQVEEWNRLYESWWHGTYLSDPLGHRLLLNNESFPRAELPGINLRCVELDNAIFDSANLSGADLRGAFLRRVNFRGANLRGADLRDAVLDEADLTKANLTGALLFNSVFRRAQLNGAIL